MCCLYVGETCIYTSKRSFNRLFRSREGCIGEGVREGGEGGGRGI